MILSFFCLRFGHHFAFSSAHAPWTISKQNITHIVIVRYRPLNWKEFAGNSLEIRKRQLYFVYLVKKYMGWKNLVYIYRIIYHQNKEFKRRSNSTSYVYYATFFYTSKLDINSRVYSYYLLSHSNTNPSSPYVDCIKKLIISGTIVPSMKSRV